jgi:hypothetical protein
VDDGPVPERRPAFPKAYVSLEAEVKVLVATDRTQGDRSDDYSFCVPGELLWLPYVCCTDRRDPRGGCGCGRGFGGLTTHRATTTGEVVDRDFTEDDLRLAIRTSLGDQGWLPDSLSEQECEEFVREVASEVRAVAEALPVGAVVRRSIDQLHAYMP